MDKKVMAFKLLVDAKITGSVFKLCIHGGWAYVLYLLYIYITNMSPRIQK